MKKNKSLFLATARLNLSQRKYCHCLMECRTLKKLNPYGICLHQSAKTLKSRPDLPQFDVKKTNCVMNYDYNRYTVKYIRALAKEKGIRITNPETKRPFSKHILVQKIIQNYQKNHPQNSIKTQDN
jgi:hypothetical protein